MSSKAYSIACPVPACRAAPWAPCKRKKPKGGWASGLYFAKRAHPERVKAAKAGPKEYASLGAELLDLMARIDGDQRLFDAVPPSLPQDREHLNRVIEIIRQYKQTR